MANYSNRSKSKLNSAEGDLQKLFNYVIKSYDNSISFGRRLPNEQFEIYKRGRTQVDSGKWVKTGQVATYKDGFKKLSKHNYDPSKAVDSWVYPIDLSLIREIENYFRSKGTQKISLDAILEFARQVLFAGYVLGVAQVLKDNGEISSDIEWGGDWNNNKKFDESFVDLPHFQKK